MGTPSFKTFSFFKLWLQETVMKARSKCYTTFFVSDSKSSKLDHLLSIKVLQFSSMLMIKAKDSLFNQSSILAATFSVARSLGIFLPNLVKMF